MLLLDVAEEAGRQAGRLLRWTIGRFFRVNLRKTVEIESGDLPELGVGVEVGLSMVVVVLYTVSVPVLFHPSMHR